MNSRLHRNIIGVFACLSLLAIFLPLSGYLILSPTIFGAKNTSGAGHKISLLSLAISDNLAAAQASPSNNAKTTNPTLDVQSVVNTMTSGSGNTPDAGVQAVVNTMTSGSGGTQTASPEKSSPISCSISTLPTCIVYLISWLINKIITYFIILFAGFSSAILALNGTLFDSPAVKVGFSIVLAFANLGFVLAIIIIAIATILRNQTYGIKQLLWKLVLMAILVNFGLVITRPIVSVADSMSEYFAGQMSNGTGDFVTNLTNAFAPQKLPGAGGGGSAPKSSGSCPTILAPMCVAGEIVLTPVDLFFGTNLGLFANTDSNVFIQSILSLVFSAVFLSLLAFSLLALAIMLLLRYLWITFLLILLPLAWLAWVFPGMSSHFQKWWHNFLRWTFFPVISLFFIYLAILIAPGSSQAGASYLSNSLGTTQFSATTNSVSGQNGTSLASMGINLAQQALTDLVLCGLMLGGLFAANSLGITGADIAVKFAKQASYGVAGYAGGLAARGGKRAASRAVPEGLKNSLQAGKLPFIPKRLQVATGIGMGKIQQAGGSQLIEKESAWAKQHSADPEEAKRLLASGGISKYRQIALLKAMANQGKVGHDTMVGGKNVGDFLDENEDNLKGRYGQGGLVKTMESSLGSNKVMRQAAAKGDNRTLAAESDKFVKSLDKTSAGKINIDSMFNNDNKNSQISKAFLASVATQNPQLFSTMINKSRGETVENMREIYETSGGAKETVEKHIEEIVNVRLKEDPENKKIQEQIDALTEKKNATMDLKIRADMDVQIKDLGSKISAQKDKIIEKTRRELGADVFSGSLINNRLSVAMPPTPETPTPTPAPASKS